MKLVILSILVLTQTTLLTYQMIQIRRVTDLKDEVKDKLNHDRIQLGRLIDKLSICQEGRK